MGNQPPPPDIEKLVHNNICKQFKKKILSKSGGGGVHRYLTPPPNFKGVTTPQPPLFGAPVYIMHINFHLDINRVQP